MGQKAEGLSKVIFMRGSRWRKVLANGVRVASRTNKLFVRTEKGSNLNLLGENMVTSLMQSVLKCKRDSLKVFMALRIDFEKGLMWALRS